MSKKFDMRGLAISLLLATVILIGGGTIASASSSTNFRLQILPLFTPPTPSNQNGGGTIVSKNAYINISGLGYPSRHISLLIDGAQYQSQYAAGAGSFTFPPQLLNPGTYTISARTIDANGKYTPFTNRTFTLQSEQVLDLDHLILPPTLSVTSEQGRMHLWGEAPPGTTVIVKMNQYNVTKNSWHSTTDSTGIFEVWDAIPTDTRDIHFEATAWSGSYQSAASWPADWFIPFSDDCRQRGDINRDCLVDLKDFSIAMFWYKKPLSPLMTKTEERALNGDGVIDLQDFSVLAYFWNP